MDRKIKPSRLLPGDKIGLFSPSAPHAAMFPRRLNRAVESLMDLSLIPIMAPNSLIKTATTAGNPSQRASDLNCLFRDNSINAIISMIGGDDTESLLPLIDFDSIKKNPKIIIGYSDITVILLAIYTKTNMVTFYGPSVLPDFGEFPYPFRYTVYWFKKVLQQNSIIGNLSPSADFIIENLPWELEDKNIRARLTKENPGWDWVKKGKGEGILIGGCLESLLKITNTEFWPNWLNSIFFWEMADTPSINYIKKTFDLLMNYDLFSQIKGMLIGRYCRSSNELSRECNQFILEYLSDFNFPIVANLDFGHTDPKLTIPIGLKSIIDSSRNSIYIVESGVM